MKTYEECRICFVEQAQRVARIAGLDPERAERVVRRVRERASTFPEDLCPARMGAEIHEIIREEGGDPDPFLAVKRSSEEMIRRLLPELAGWIDASEDPFETSMRIAIAANIIDYGANDGISEADLRETMRRTMEAEIHGAAAGALRKQVERSRRILFVGDNSAECWVDRLFLEHFPPGRTTYAVRGGPVLNDATREDAERAGIGDLAKIIDTGDAAPGVLTDRCSPEFLDHLRRADLILAKGQGNYESLGGRSDRAYAFLLKAKCPVVARDIGCEVGDIVLLLPGGGEARGLSSAEPAEIMEGGL